MTHAKDILYPPEGQEVIIPTKLCDVDNWDEITPEERGKIRLILRDNYNKTYYRENREKALKYQQDYNLKHQKPYHGKSRHARFLETRELVQAMFTKSDIMHSPMGKTELIVGQILDGTRGLVS